MLLGDGSVSQTALLASQCVESTEGEAHFRKGGFELAKNMLTSEQDYYAYGIPP